MKASEMPSSAQIELSPIDSPQQATPRDNSASLGFQDVEAQVDQGDRPSAVRRAATATTQGSVTACEYTPPLKRGTGISGETTLISRPTLERVPTFRVEDDMLHGYPRLASYLGGEEGYAIYKRFATLNARNLLYWQAKLTHLEHELDVLEKTYRHQQHLHYKVHHIFFADGEPGSPGLRLREQHEKISEALDKYNRLLLDQRRLHEIPAADTARVVDVYDFINDSTAPKPDWLEHPENTIYAVYDDPIGSQKNWKTVHTDLVTLNPDFATTDSFTRFVKGPLLRAWDKLMSISRQSDDEYGGHAYSQKTLYKMMDIVVVFIASALPTLSIVALYFIHSPTWRLVFVVLFSGLFASALALMTDAKRVEIFTASAALASVQVVFVGTAFGNGNSNANA